MTSMGKIVRELHLVVILRFILALNCKLDGWTDNTQLTNQFLMIVVM